MIPKIIHFCWFGGNTKPDFIKECIKSWELFLPGYKIIEWNEKNTEFTNKFVKNAYKLKQWAFVSDYVRLEKLHQLGGVYLDTDMLLVKNIDNLLTSKMFIGCENKHTISAGIIGAQKEHTFLKQLLDNYSDLKINKFTNLYDIAIPKVITTYFRNKYDYTNHFDVILEFDDMTIYPSDYFYSLPSLNMYKNRSYKEFITANSYAVHLWGESWLKPSEFELLRNGKYTVGIKSAFYSFYQQENKLKYIKKIISSIKQSFYR